MTGMSRLVIKDPARKLYPIVSTCRSPELKGTKTSCSNLLKEPVVTLQAPQRQLCTSILRYTNRFRTPTIEPSTVSDAVRRWSHILESNGDPEAVTAVGLIVAHVMGNKMLHDVNLETVVTTPFNKKIQQLCERRLKREPVQYILGEWDFCDLTLEMRPPVLIPRPETEELVELIETDWTQKVQTGGHTDVQFLDIGCGSGAISLYLLKHCPTIHCVAVDANEEACDLTHCNAEKIGVQDRLSVIQGNIYSEELLETLTAKGPYDVIASNPPYITTEEMSELDLEVSGYEDHMALHGGAQGFDVVQRILNISQELLKPSHGCLWFEVGLRHPDMIAEWVKQNPQYGLTYLDTYLDHTKRPRFSKMGLMCAHKK